MKILFILEYYHPHVGGVETLFRNLVDRLSAAGNEITVLTNQFDKTLPKVEREGNITIRRLPYRNRYLFTFLSVFAAVGLAKKHDLIHTTSYNAAVPAFFASRLTRTKALITFHEVWGHLWFDLPWISFPSKIVHFMFEQIILKMNFDQFIAVSDFTKAALIKNGVNSKRVSRIYNGIDYSEFENRKPSKPSSNPTFLYFGRVGVSKGIDIVLKSVELLVKEYQDFQINLIVPDKDDHMTKKVRSIIHTKDLGRNITIIKSIPFDQLKKRIAESDAVIVPSYSEGFCFAAVETMAIGTPLISSGQGALKEVVGGKFLQFEKMSPQSLKEQLVNAINGQWEEGPTKKFELGKSVKSYIDFYDKILAL